MMRRTLAILLLSITATAAFAQAPEPGERPRFGRGYVSERDFEEAGRFMAEHAPNRWAATQALPEEMRRGVMNFIVARYRSVSQLEGSDPDLYKMKIEQLSTEDDLYGMLSVRDAERREQIREDIAKAVKKLVELNIAEREYRLTRLKKEVQEEESRLAADRSGAEEQVKTRTDLVIAEGTAGLRRDFTSHRWDRRRGGDRPQD